MSRTWRKEKEPIEWFVYCDYDWEKETSFFFYSGQEESAASCYEIMGICETEKEAQIMVADLNRLGKHFMGEDHIDYKK